NARGEIRLTLIARVEVYFDVETVSGAVDRKGVIEPQRPDWQVEPDSNAHVGGEIVMLDRSFLCALSRNKLIAQAEIVGIGVHETGIVKDGATRFFDDRERVFNGR